MENVSYGSRDSECKLADGTRYSFAENTLKNVTRIDERNLVGTKFLNLDYSSVMQLDTSTLKQLRVLRLNNTGI